MDLISDGKQWKEEVIKVTERMDYNFVSQIYPPNFYKSIIRKAKRDKGKDGKPNWEKAEYLELLPQGGNSFVPAGMRALTA